jgi:phosphoribosylglycinamide formyltransferase-1
VQLSEEDTPESVADKIHKLEYNYFPGVIEELILSEIEREKASKG